MEAKSQGCSLLRLITWSPNFTWRKSVTGFVTCGGALSRWNLEPVLTRRCTVSDSWPCYGLQHLEVGVTVNGS